MTMPEPATIELAAFYVAAGFAAVSLILALRIVRRAMLNLDRDRS